MTCVQIDNPGDPIEPERRMRVMAVGERALGREFHGGVCRRRTRTYRSPITGTRC
jgi:hypothetical protein